MHGCGRGRGGAHALTSSLNLQRRLLPTAVHFSSHVSATVAVSRHLAIMANGADLGRIDTQLSANLDPDDEDEASPKTLQHSGKGQTSREKSEREKRTYRACLHCRQRKSRCDLYVALHFPFPLLYYVATSRWLSEEW